MSLDRRRNDGERITVAARRLSSFVEEEIHLLKVDVEGAERALMQDLVDSGKLRMIKEFTWNTIIISTVTSMTCLHS